MRERRSAWLIFFRCRKEKILEKCDTTVAAAPWFELPEHSGCMACTHMEDGTAAVIGLISLALGSHSLSF